MSSTNAADQTIEQLKERFDALNTRRIRIQTQRENAQERLNELRKQALEQFGTDDLEQLQAKLAEMKTQNEKQMADYQKSLDEIEKSLVSIDESFTGDDELTS